MTETRKLSNKAIKKQRQMKYFMDATEEIIAESGVESVTVREVCARAGYNPPSLYLHFESLEQLINYSCMDMVTEYYEALSKLWNAEADSLSKYITVWKVYCKYSFASPAIYAYVFASKKTEDFYALMDEYYDAFPDKCGDTSDFIDRVRPGKTTKGNEEIVIRPCVEEGLISKENADRIIDIATILHDGLMWRAYFGIGSPSVDELVDRFMDLFLEYISPMLPEGYEYKEVELS